MIDHTIEPVDSEEEALIAHLDRLEAKIRSQHEKEERIYVESDYTFEIDEAEGISGHYRVWHGHRHIGSFWRVPGGEGWTAHPYYRKGIIGGAIKPESRVCRDHHEAIRVIRRAYLG
jgi:hypothetical protein